MLDHPKQQNYQKQKDYAVTLKYQNSKATISQFRDKKNT